MKSVLFGVAADHRQQFFGTCRPLGIIEAGPRHMRFEVFGDNLVHEAIHRPAHGGNQMEHVGTRRVRLKYSLDRADLSGDATNAGDQIDIGLRQM